MTPFIWSSTTGKNSSLETKVRMGVTSGVGLLTDKEQEVVWGAGNVLYLVLGGGFLSIHICKNSSNWTLKMYALYCIPIELQFKK